MRFLSLLLILLFSLSASEVNGQSYMIDTWLSPNGASSTGYIFKVRATRSVLIESFFLRNQIAGKVIVYYKEGDYDLRTTSLNDMTIFSNETYYDSGGQTIFPNSSVLLKSGTYYTFYFLGDTGLHYHGDYTDRIVRADGNLIIYKGDGLLSGLSSANLPDRAFAGAINYKMVGPVPTISEIWFFAMIIGLAAFGVYFVVVRRVRVLTV